MTQKRCDMVTLTIDHDGKRYTYRIPRPYRVALQARNAECDDPRIVADLLSIQPDPPPPIELKIEPRDEPWDGPSWTLTVEPIPEEETMPERQTCGQCGASLNSKGKCTNPLCPADK